MSVPEVNYTNFLAYLDSYEEFKHMPIKAGVEDDGKSFYKLAIKVRKKIVADGLQDGTFDVTNVGKHLDAVEFNEALDLPGTIVVDMRNHYETEIGHFENAICPDVDTFREELPLVAEMLKDKKDHKIDFVIRYYFGKTIRTGPIDFQNLKYHETRTIVIELEKLLADKKNSSIA
jgi:UPF0176 protein